MTMRRFGLAVLAASVLLSACSSGGAKDAFDGRKPLPSCGTFSVAHGQPPTAGSDCLRAAMREGKGAELVISRLTQEGDPVVSYLRTMPGQDGVEVFTDSTKDSYGSKKWTRSVCKRFDAATSQVSGCRD